MRLNNYVAVQPNASIKVKRVYRYSLIPTGEVKYCRGSISPGCSRIRRLYDLAPIDDVTAIYSLSQVIREI